MWAMSSKCKDGGYNKMSDILLVLRLKGLYPDAPPVTEDSCTNGCQT